ncbi:MAG: hypothetical protein ABIJ09_12050 [Pseudomonadota bacterium]
MGLFRSISRAVGGIARSISRPLSRITSFANKAMSFIQKPLSMLNKITEPFKQALGGMLDKLPGGIGKMLKPFVDKFFNSALSFVAGGPLGAFGQLAGFASQAGKAVDLLNTVNSAVGGLQNGLTPEGISNIAQIFAKSQAARY